ncbi:InlB B-repeat-containing protein [Paenibacillaceae bacterium WGS1546]|uniref:InlB B-repeat-containing protein n=1 Tax=Cohnella sp. WGS1546 TaxID=3366810 RepID=UPI00372D799C
MRFGWQKTRLLALAMLMSLACAHALLTPGENRAHAAASRWGPVGNPSFTAGGAGYVSMSVDNGTPYVAYSDWANGYKATVMKYNGSGWELVGNAGFSAGAVTSVTIQVSNGVPYVAYLDQGDGERAKVMKYDGGSWSHVGGSVSDAGAGFLSMYVDNGTPYVAFQDRSSQFRGTAKRFNGSGWDMLGGGHFTANQVNETSVYVDNGNLYIAYHLPMQGRRATVVRLDGNSWQTVGNAGFSAGQAETLSLFVHANTPYLAYKDSAYGGRATVAMFNGSVWEMLGGPGFTSGNADYTSLYVNNGIPYIAFQNSDYRATVMKYNGTAWETVGNAGFSAGLSSYLSLRFDSGVPYVAYQDHLGVTPRVTVSKLRHTVSYDGNGSTGGAVPAEPTGYDKNAAIAVLGNEGNLERTGYSFAGWNTAADGSGVAYGAGDSMTMGDNAVTLYAQWTLDEYSLVYDGNGNTGGSPPPTLRYPYQAIVGIAGNSGSLERTGYSFAGWNTAADGSGTNYAEGDALTIGTDDVTLYAKWTPNRYTLHYAGNGHEGGDAPASGDYDYGTIVSVSDNTGQLTKTGHTFAGWNTEADGSGTHYAAGAAFPMGAGDMTLYAQWAVNRYQVSYNGNGHTGGQPPAASSHDYGSGVAVQGNAGSLVKTGHTFAGWNTAADGSGTSYAPEETLSLGASDVTLFAQWTINRYLVSYDGNGSDGGSVPAEHLHDYGSAVTVQGNAGNLSKTGHAFADWNTKQDGSGTRYAATNVFTMGAEDVTLYAQWTANRYTVSFESNGGTEVDDQSVVYGHAITPPSDPTKTGHTFDGWYSDASLQTPFSFGTPIGAADVKLFAKWSVNSYEVAYNGNGHSGGSAPESGSYDYDASVTVQGNVGGLSRTGHTFAGWNTAANGTGTFYGEGDTFTLGAEDVTLYAVWTVNRYVVSYAGNGNDSGSVPGDGVHDYLSNIVVSDNIGNLGKIGHSFAGWNTEADGTGTSYAAGGALVLGAENVTLYAQWTPNSYTVSFESNGGTEVDDQSVVYGHAIAPPSDPTKTGHTFDGWYSDEGLQTPFSFGTPIGAADVTLYAKWSINSYTVGFNSNGGSDVDSQTVVYGQWAAEPEEPTKTGFTFMGWYADEELQTPFRFETPIGAADMTLHALWSINSYTVVYDGNGSTGGAVPASGSHDYHSVVTVFGNPGGLERTGHTFSGWNTAADGTGTGYAAEDTFTIGAEGVTLYAQWTVNRYPLSYQGNGHTGGSVPEGGNYDYNALVAVPENTGGLVKEGYTFAGWNTAADGSGTDYRPGETLVMGDGAMILFAQWLSNNALLSFLSVDPLALSPSFSPSILNYEVDLDYAETELSLAFSQGDPTQVVSVTGAVYQSVTGAVYHYAATDLSVGPNPIRIEVTAQDGTMNAYVVTVHRELGNDANLSGLSLSAGTLSPTFAPGTTSYSANVPNGVSTLTVTATASNARAAIAVNGQPVENGQPGAAIALAVGNNPIAVEVTARDGTKKTYAINVRRASSASSGGGGGGPVAPPASGNGQFTLPAGQGGEVRLGDAVSVTIPAGATEQELQVSLKEPDAPLPSNFVPVGPVIAVESNRTEPFLKPVTVTLTFDPAKVGRDQEPAVFYYDETNGSWTRVEGRVSANRISVDVDRLRPMAVVAVEKAAEPSPGSPSVPSFADIAGHWAEASIRRAVAAGIASGYPDGSFQPNRTVTRAEFAVLLAKALNLQGEAGDPGFADAERIGAWAKEAVARAVQAGILKGYQDGTFRPGAEITRAEMAVMIAGALGRKPEPNGATSFSDDRDIPKWAKGAVGETQRLGLIQGKGAGRFDPFGKTTRAEAVTVILKLLDTIDQ